MGEEIGRMEVPMKWAELYPNTGYEGGFLEQRIGEDQERLTLNNESMGSKRD